MEFKFRAVDDRPISYILPSSGFRHSSTQVPGGQFLSILNDSVWRLRKLNEIEVYYFYALYSVLNL